MNAATRRETIVTPTPASTRKKLCSESEAASRNQKQRPDVYSFTVEGKAVPCPRPRVTGKRTYMPVKYTQWRDLVAWHALAVAGRPLWTGAISINLAFYNVDLRADWDNLAKGVCDALEGIFYANDNQITQASVNIFEDLHLPARVNVIVSRVLE